MKKIIKGKRYDTDKAKELGSDSYSNPRDFNYWSETLYQKNSGEFFLYGEGGPMSRYAVSISQNGLSGGEKIIPLSVESAQKWAEEHLSADEYEEIFGEVQEESADKRTVTLSLPEYVIKKIRICAAKEQIPMSEFLSRIVTEYQK